MQKGSNSFFWRKVINSSTRGGSPALFIGWFGSLYRAELPVFFDWHFPA
jgi:hypothetical protein